MTVKTVNRDSVPKTCVGRIEQVSIDLTTQRADFLVPLTKITDIEHFYINANGVNDLDANGVSAGMSMKFADTTESPFDVINGMTHASLFGDKLYVSSPAGNGTLKLIVYGF